MAIKVSMVSLGCPKNQVDAEWMLAQIAQAGYQIVTDSGTADVVIVNTCGFIQSAQEEAIEHLLEFITLKKEGRVKKIVVTGCLAERFQDSIREEMPDIDAVVGIGSNQKIVSIIGEVLRDKKVRSYGPKEELPLEGERILTNLPFFAYLKIAEGCDNCCSYCAIPSIRGRFRSRAMESILAEAEQLAAHGVKELVVVAQDTTRYGEDIYGEYKLAELLRKLAQIDGLVWIRVLYAYPERITDELLDVMANEPKIAKYLDIPLQHCNPDILAAMNRRGSRAEIEALIGKIRAKVPGITLRTTLIAGFPGETEAQFAELCQFVKDLRFDRLGCFAYSAEEETPAAGLPGQIEEQVKIDRSELVMAEQMNIMAQKNEAMIGKQMMAVVEGFDRFGECFFGRTEMDAPDIDGKIFFQCPGKLAVGQFVKVKITDTLDLDLIGEVVQ